MPQLIAGNWKMHGLSPSLAEIEAVAENVAATPPPAEILLCPPATLISRAVRTADGRIAIGGQDCSPESFGAFTGDISAEMLADAGATAVIVGHSERRQLHGETGELVRAKTLAAWQSGLLAIICIGEVEAERESGSQFNVCKDQIAASVPEGAWAVNAAIAYEPVWAIGTGRTPSAAEIGEMHAHIRECLIGNLGEEGRTIRILYGGSVNPSNAGKILSTHEVGGALVGGASLKAADFLAIVAAVRAA